MTAEAPAYLMPGLSWYSILTTSFGRMAAICAGVDSTPLPHSITLPPDGIVISPESGLTVIQGICSLRSRSTPSVELAVASLSGRITLRSFLSMTGEAVTVISFRSIAGSSAHTEGAAVHINAHMIYCLSMLSGGWSVFNCQRVIELVKAFAQIFDSVVFA